MATRAPGIFYASGVYHSGDPRSPWNRWIPAQGIYNDVIQADIQYYLGQGAAAYYTLDSENSGVYIIAALSSFDDTHLANLRNDSAAWQRESASLPTGSQYFDSVTRRARFPSHYQTRRRTDSHQASVSTDLNTRLRYVNIQDTSATTPRYQREQQPPGPQTTASGSEQENGDSSDSDDAAGGQTWTAEGRTFFRRVDGVTFELINNQWIQLQRS